MIHYRTRDYLFLVYHNLLNIRLRLDRFKIKATLLNKLLVKTS